MPAISLEGNGMKLLFTKLVEKFGATNIQFGMAYAAVLCLCLSAWGTASVFS